MGAQTSISLGKFAHACISASALQCLHTALHNIFHVEFAHACMHIIDQIRDYPWNDLAYYMDYIQRQVHGTNNFTYIKI